MGNDVINVYGCCFTINTRLFYQQSDDRRTKKERYEREEQNISSWDKDSTLYERS